MTSFLKYVQHVSMLANVFAIDCCLLCNSNVTLIRYKLIEIELASIDRLNSNITMVCEMRLRA